ncbi:MAG: thiamine pyrophosphate-requiring protein, partial [Gammaproteobacteria bacterium]|nr:thiamine pyrophosphate-requiring protein [Gammaproteobacteria bacterium]
RLLGTRASWYLMQHCDTLLMVGTTFPYEEFLPPEGRARAVQIDIEPRNVGMRYPTEVNLIGDSAATLRALLPLLVRKQSRSWQQQIAGQVGKWWKDLETRAMKSAEPINPQRVFWELSPRLPDDVILCGDSGSSANWYACDLKMRRGMKASLSGKLASMGSGVPYAIAAKMAFPERPVIAVVGDGAMQMNGNAELLTVKQYWRRWENPCFIVLVLVNHDLNMVTWEQRVLAGDPKFPAAQEVIDFPYAQYGEMLGLKGIRVDKAADIAAAWDLALAADRPVVIEFVTDPNVPPLPPHLTSEQALDYLRALIKVDPDQWQIIKQSAKQLLPF